MKKLTYKDSGVDVAAADQLVGEYGKLAKSATTENVLSGIGGFAGFMALPKGMKEPVLVACTDGVGTKLRLIVDAGQPATAGKDAAAMCLNDMATSGAKPLFMLDYLATGKLEPGVAKEIVSGFADYCRQSGCALLGGETAEMPGFYPPGDFDVAGFSVGVVDKEEIIDGKDCKPGDIVIGLASSGVHSNGFSLVRMLIDKGLIDLNKTYPGMDITMGEALLAPTRLYYPLALDLAKLGVKAMAHITGGGLPGNIARTVPQELDVVLDSHKWPLPPVYRIMQEAGVPRDEMFATFNMGIGYTVITQPSLKDQVIELCQRAGTEAWEIGQLQSGSGKVVING